MKTEIKLLVSLLVLLAGSFTAYAIGPAGVQWVQDTSYRDFAGGAANSDLTEGGNITSLNITNVNSTTERWAGYLGNLSSTGMMVVLANDNADIFYNWTWDNTQGGELCAGISTSYTWNDLEAATAVELDTAWAFADASDDAEATFLGGESITIGGATVAAISADTGDNVGDTFETSAIVDTAAAPADTNFLFCTELQIAGTTYTGGTADYEIIVPVTYGATETYYFYVELD